MTHVVAGCRRVVVGPYLASIRKWGQVTGHDWDLHEGHAPQRGGLVFCVGRGPCAPTASGRPLIRLWPLTGLCQGHVSSCAAAMGSTCTPFGLAEAAGQATAAPRTLIMLASEHVLEQGWDACLC